MHSPLTLKVNLPVGTVGLKYVGSIIASGGQIPYSYSVVSGSTPLGTKLNPNGRVTGTPLNSGSFPFEVQAKDSVGDSALKSLVIIIKTRPAAFHCECFDTDFEICH